MKKIHYYIKNLLLLSLTVPLMFACSKSSEQGFSRQQTTDIIHSVLKADRTVYTKYIVNRLSIKEKVIKASEHWKDDKALVLPAQMFRLASELVAKENSNFSYALVSLWAINKQNKPRTKVEKEGLAFLNKNPQKNYYSEEELGGKRYFTALYADKAIAKACVSCHNDHKDSPRTDFKLGDTMGAVVIRIKLD